MAELVREERQFGLIVKKILAIDWLLLGSAVLISCFGIITMSSLVGESGQAEKQLIWLLISIFSFFFLSLFDYRFLRRTWVVTLFYVFNLILLGALFIFGKVSKGAQGWFDFGSFSFQPVELMKLAMVILLAKYFTKRHIEIANIRHILVSGFYAFMVFVLVFLQPDFGSGLIIFLIWLGMILVSGISKKHLMAVFLLGLIAFSTLWFFALADYQKARIKTFIDPLSDIRGSGYSAYQSTIAVGSGQILGKGIGYGTQSKLKFLPEYQTDFIFAAFAEEWGFFGVLILFCLFSFMIFRLFILAINGASNFETLFSIGLIILIISHFLINVGMNIGLMPVTGITFPFMSYGGSNLLMQYSSFGLIAGMSRYRRTAHKDEMHNEFLGI